MPHAVRHSFVYDAVQNLRAQLEDVRPGGRFVHTTVDGNVVLGWVVDVDGRKWCGLNADGAYWTLSPEALQRVDSVPFRGSWIRQATGFRTRFEAMRTMHDMALGKTNKKKTKDRCRACRLAILLFAIAGLTVPWLGAAVHRYCDA